MRVLFLLAIVLLSASPCFSSQERDTLISQQLNCFEQRPSDASINWNDVCYMGLSSQVQEHREQVALALDEQERIKNPSATQMEQIKDVSSTLVPSDRDGRKYQTMSWIPDNIKQRLDPRHVHSLNMNIQPFHYHYNEVIGVDIKGTMTGYGAAYAYRPSDSNPLNNSITNTYMIEGLYATGDIDYSSSNGKINDVGNDFYEIRGLIGKDYLLADQSIITPYFGFAYRHLYYESNDRQAPDGAWGYDRISQYYYLPLGFYASIPAGALSAVLNGEFDIFLGGRQFSELSSVSKHTAFEYPDIKNNQSKGYGIRGSVRLSYDSKSVSIFAEPFIRFWSIADSNVVSADVTSNGVYVGTLRLYEPKNTTFEIGSKFGLQF